MTLRRNIALVLLFGLLAGCAHAPVVPQRLPLLEPSEEDSRRLKEQAKAEEARQREAARVARERDARRTEREQEEAQRAFLEKVAQRVWSFVGARRVIVDGRRFRKDCSGLVQASLHAAGALDLAEELQATSHIDRYCRENGSYHTDTPVPGDLVLFEETYDRNRNRRLDDGITHVGVVVEVKADATVVFVHVGSGTIKTGRMNLLHPDVHRLRSPGRVVNSFLRVKRRWDVKGTRYLAGQLFRGFCRVTLEPKEGAPDVD